jgi:hypothetical protein
MKEHMYKFEMTQDEVNLAIELLRENLNTLSSDQQCLASTMLAHFVAMRNTLTNDKNLIFNV